MNRYWCPDDIWVNLGRAMATGATVSINGSTYTDQDCFIQAIEKGHSDFAVWNDISTTIPIGAYARIQGVMLSRMDCLVRSLSLNASHEFQWIVWLNLCSAMLDGTNIVVRGKSYTKQACWVRAQKGGLQLSAAWYT